MMHAIFAQQPQSEASVITIQSQNSKHVGLPFGYFSSGIFSASQLDGNDQPWLMCLKHTKSPTIFCMFWAMVHQMSQINFLTSGPVVDLVFPQRNSEPAPILLADSVKCVRMGLNLCCFRGGGQGPPTLTQVVVDKQVVLPQD